MTEKEIKPNLEQLERDYKQALDEIESMLAGFITQMDGAFLNLKEVKKEIENGISEKFNDDSYIVNRINHCSADNGLFWKTLRKLGTLLADMRRVHKDVEYSLLPEKKMFFGNDYVDFMNFSLRKEIDPVVLHEEAKNLRKRVRNELKNNSEKSTDKKCSPATHIFIISASGKNIPTLSDKFSIMYPRNNHGACPLSIFPRDSVERMKEVIFGLNELMGLSPSLLSNTPPNKVKELMWDNIPVEIRLIQPIMHYDVKLGYRLERSMYHNDVDNIVSDIIWEHPQKEKIIIQYKLEELL